MVDIAYDPLFLHGIRATAVISGGSWWLLRFRVCCILGVSCSGDSIGCFLAVISTAVVV